MTYFRAKAVVAAAVSALLLQLAVGVAAAQDKPGEITKRLIGTWRLVAYIDEKDQPIRGPRPTGLIFYDAAGNMAAQIMPDRERPKFKFGEATLSKRRTYSRTIPRTSAHTRSIQTRGLFDISARATSIRVRWANSCGDLNLPKADA